jgi:hypothetical protein
MATIVHQQEKFVSRKITINLDQHQVNVRPIIKGKHYQIHSIGY